MLNLFDRIRAQTTFLFPRYLPPVINKLLLKPIMGTLRKSNFVGILKVLVVLGLIYLVSNVYQLEFEKDPSCDIVFVPQPPVQRQLAMPPKSPPDPVAPPVPVIEVPKEKVKCALGTGNMIDQVV